MGIVETIVGILIGLVVLLVIYNVLSLAEGYKRTTIGVADTQTTGLFAQFVLNREISNAGNGIAIGMPEFSTCNNGPSGAGDWRLKPIPVLITDSGNNNVSDSFVVFYSNTFRGHESGPVPQRRPRRPRNSTCRAPMGSRTGTGSSRPTRSPTAG